MEPRPHRSFRGTLEPLGSTAFDFRRHGQRKGYTSRGLATIRTLTLACIGGSQRMAVAVTKARGDNAIGVRNSARLDPSSRAGLSGISGSLHQLTGMGHLAKTAVSKTLLGDDRIGIRRLSPSQHYRRILRNPDRMAAMVKTSPSVLLGWTTVPSLHVGSQAETGTARTLVFGISWPSA